MAQTRVHKKTLKYHINSAKNGQESLRFMGPKVWEMVPVTIKNASYLSIFKNNIKSWIPERCPCRLCKDYVPGLGYAIIT